MKEDTSKFGRTGYDVISEHFWLLLIIALLIILVVWYLLKKNNVRIEVPWVKLEPKPDAGNFESGVNKGDDVSSSTSSKEGNNAKQNIINDKYQNDTTMNTNQTGSGNSNESNLNTGNNTGGAVGNNNHIVNGNNHGVNGNVSVSNESKFSNESLNRLLNYVESEREQRGFQKKLYNIDLLNGSNGQAAANQLMNALVAAGYESEYIGMSTRYSEPFEGLQMYLDSETFTFVFGHINAGYFETIRAGEAPR